MDKNIQHNVSKTLWCKKIKQLKKNPQHGTCYYKKIIEMITLTLLWAG